LDQKSAAGNTDRSPPTGDRLAVAVGLTGSEDPADSVFRNLKGRSLPRIPQSGPQNPAVGVLRSPGTTFRAGVRRVLWGRGEERKGEVRVRREPHVYLKIFLRIACAVNGTLCSAGANTTDALMRKLSSKLQSQIIPNYTAQQQRHMCL